jgi:alginate O-acetyltransferase complex protein AlgI
MLFNSIEFIFLFLPVALAVFYGLARYNPFFAQIWLCLASFFFYGYWNISFVGLLAASIVFNFFFGLCIDSLGKRPRFRLFALMAAITGNLLALCYYKYFPSLVNSQPSLLPLGISFFTFTQIGYLIDRAQSGIMERNIVRYTLFVTFFPHLIAGPILHHKEMMPQFSDPTVARWRPENISVGTALFVMGLAKKVLLADNLAPFAEAGFGHPALIPAETAWFTVVCYSMQLYFDFSGYSDMAIGISKMFGIRFPLNFNSPYKAQSIIEFWQRWHMTLTRYLNLYLYNPVALWMMRRRAAKGLPYGPKSTKTVSGFSAAIIVPVVFTMALAGIWHGAGLQFLIFGLLHATYLTINHAWRVFGPNESKRTSRFHSIIWKTPLTFLAVTMGWIFFRANSLGDAFDMLAAMRGWHGFAPNGFQPPWALLATSFAIVWLTPNSQQLLATFNPSLTKVEPHWPNCFSWKPNFLWALGLSSLFIVCMTKIDNPARFLYFQF